MAARRRFRAFLSVSVVVLSTWSLAGASAAPRPPAPKGVAILAAGALPHVCAAGDTKFGATGYGPASGYYYSPTANAWLSAPLCYPRWGNLVMSAPQIVHGGGQATVTAIPTDGSNSATWAIVKPGAVQWPPAGTPVKKSCLPTTLTCTVQLPPAGPEWQWLMFQVSMPRTYFIDSPGEFCAGQHACAGVTTNGWTYVGIPPAGAKAPPEPEKNKCDAQGVSAECVASVSVDVTAADPKSRLGALLP